MTIRYAIADIPPLSFEQAREIAESLFRERGTRNRIHLRAFRDATLEDLDGIWEELVPWLEGTIRYYEPLTEFDGAPYLAAGALQSPEGEALKTALLAFLHAHVDLSECVGIHAPSYDITLERK